MGDRDTVRSKEPRIDREQPTSNVHSVQPAKEPVEAARRAGQDQPRVSASGPIANDPARAPHAAVYAVPFDDWFRELDEVLVDYCKRGRDGSGKS